MCNYNLFAMKPEEEHCTHIQCIVGAMHRLVLSVPPTACPYKGTNLSDGSIVELQSVKEVELLACSEHVASDVVANGTCNLSKNSQT